MAQGAANTPEGWGRKENSGFGKHPCSPYFSATLRKAPHKHKSRNFAKQSLVPWFKTSLTEHSKSCKSTLLLPVLSKLPLNGADI